MAMFSSQHAFPKASSSPISIGWPGTSPRSSISASSSVSSNSSLSSNWSTTTTCSNGLSTAFPSWPTRKSLSPTLHANDSTQSASIYNSNNVPSSYISDLDLFPEDLEHEAQMPCLAEAPAPPRDLPPPPVMMPLPPLLASERPQRKPRRSSKKSPKAAARPMTPIAECPLAAPA